MRTTDFTVTGMSCGHCESAVREEVTDVSGVTGVEVSAAEGTLRVTSDGELDVDAEASAVITAVDEAGYTAVRS